MSQRIKPACNRLVACLLALASLFILAAPARAHVGSKDVFEQVESGPYKLFVTIRTPLVIPGVAIVEVRSIGAPVRSIRITPIPLTGAASRNAPTPDAMRVSPDDPKFFTGSLWLMASGSWQVRLEIDGAAGPATAGVPVAAAALAVLPMQRSLGMLLAILGVLLVVGMTGIAAAAVREARLAPGVAPSPTRRQRALFAGAATLAVLLAIVYFGNRWWKVEAAAYAQKIYRPMDLHTALNGDTLTLTLGDLDPDTKQWSADSLDNYLLDHGHIMHLYAIRWPQMDAAFHLHPAPVPGAHGADDTLRLTLPTMPPGQYHLYADVVHRNGFPETLTATLTIPPGLPPTPLASEDASAHPAPISAGELGPVSKLPDSYTMVWDRPAVITASTPYIFRFRLLDPQGKPAADVQPYLGMAGHAAFVKTDGTVFAHTHPDGSAAMPAMMLAEAANGPANASGASGMSSMSGGMEGMPGMGDMSAAPGASAAPKPLPPIVEFPYGFPTPGRYRIFIQMKHGATVETGVFDTEVK